MQIGYTARTKTNLNELLNICIKVCRVVYAYKNLSNSIHHPSSKTVSLLLLPIIIIIFFLVNILGEAANTFDISVWNGFPCNWEGALDRSSILRVPCSERFAHIIRKHRELFQKFLFFHCSFFHGSNHGSLCDHLFLQRIRIVVCFCYLAKSLFVCLHIYRSRFRRGGGVGWACQQLWQDVGNVHLKVWDETKVGYI